VLLLAAAVLQRRKVASRICFWLAVAVLLVCGNGWVDAALARHLERQYPSLASQPSTLSPQPPQADCIVVLGGGTVEKTRRGRRSRSPRPGTACSTRRISIGKAKRRAWSAPEASLNQMAEHLPVVFSDF